MNLEPQSRMGKFWLAIALLFTWSVMAVFVANFAAYYLAYLPNPDGAPTPGTWPYVAGGIFLDGPGTILVGVSIACLSINLTYRAFRRHLHVMQQMIIYNFLFIGALFFFVPLSQWLTKNRAPLAFDRSGMFISYEVSLLPMAVMILLLAIWFRAQWKLTSGRKRKVEEAGIW